MIHRSVWIALTTEKPYNAKLQRNEGWLKTSAQYRQRNQMFELVQTCFTHVMSEFKLQLKCGVACVNVDVW